MYDYEGIHLCGFTNNVFIFTTHQQSSTPREDVKVGNYFFCPDSNYTRHDGNGRKSAHNDNVLRRQTLYQVQKCETRMTNVLVSPSEYRKCLNIVRKLKLMSGNYGFCNEKLFLVNLDPMFLRYYKDVDLLIYCLL